MTVFLVPYTFRGAVEITVPKFGIFESNFTHEGNYKNPYLETEAYAELTRPDKAIWSIPLFWDGGNIWKLRISPDKEGTWTFRITSKDKGLNGKKGKFTCVASDLKGSYIPMKNHPHHFQYQNGEPVWFMGETAWALFTDNKSEKHERPEVEEFIRTRSSQGFNTVHAMLFSEAGWGNSGGMPFKNLALQEVNPAYWQEVDERIEYTNNKGIIVGLVLAWGDKNRKVPFPWRLFPDLEARKRYARYIAARYSAYNVYFILSGEWHAEAKTRPAPEAEIKKEFIEIGAELKRWEPHSRMIGIHPMTSHGSVREFNEADWMSFGDYQQNYHSLHERMLESMKFNKPVVNAEYAYYLRDQNGDGKPDKENSVNIECIRHASWDIVMSGGYLVTGFGTTYFGGYRDPGPFDVNTPKNDDWEKQAGIMKEFFTKLNWWKLNSFDQWLVCNQVPGSDTRVDGVIAPPVTACWLLADPGNTYVIYARGVDEEIILQQNSIPEGKFKTVLFNPATGNTTYKGEIIFAENVFKFKTPDKGDWVILLTKK
ncbi:MAG: apiosidase-like domain-containing protein [Bacteroidales bacterium]